MVTLQAAWISKEIRPFPVCSVKNVGGHTHSAAFNCVNVVTGPGA